MNLQSVIEIKNQNTDFLFGKGNVVACGVGYKKVDGRKTDELCVVVSVQKKLPVAQIIPSDIIPQAIGSVKTDVQETGIIRALQSRTNKWFRPVPCGVSCGHVDITAGTLGCLVERDGVLFILSNNHVLANTNKARLGDAILQPGPVDGGTLDDRIAVLEKFVPINFNPGSSDCPIANGIERLLNVGAKLLGSSYRVTAHQSGPNLVDAAIARPLWDFLVEKRILEIGEPQGTTMGALGMKVQKSGRTTGLTKGQIIQIDVTARVSYGDSKLAIFEKQFMAGAMSAGGDSGSAVLDEGKSVIGLLFAGSDVTTIINPIQFVLDSLNVVIA